MALCFPHFSVAQSHVFLFLCSPQDWTQLLSSRHPLRNARWTDLEPVREFHPEVPSVLRDRILAKLIPGGVRVALVEQVVQAHRSLQPAEHVLGKEGGVGDKKASDGRL